MDESRSGASEWGWTYAVEDHQGGIHEGGIKFCFAGLRTTC